jgi:hypothetical protein
MPSTWSVVLEFLVSKHKTYHFLCKKRDKEPFAPHCDVADYFAEERKQEMEMNFALVPGQETDMEGDNG